MEKYDLKKITTGALLTVALLASLFTSFRVSTAINALDETLETPLVGYLPEDVQAQIDVLQDRWAELAPLVVDIEDLVDVFGALETQGTTNFDSLTLEADLVVGDDATVTDNITVTGDIAVTGDSTFSGDLTADDVFAIDDLDSTIAGTQTLTPTATYYQLSPATTLTLTLATGSADDGDLLILHNMVSTNTVVVDTGATVGGGNITLSTNDLAFFVYGNMKWVEVVSPDNS